MEYQQIVPLDILSNMDNLELLQLAQQQAKLGAAEGGHAVGAVLAKGGEVIAAEYDRTIQLNDPIALAEFECIRAAGRRNDHAELSLYSTNSPNLLVAGVVIQFGIGALVVGEAEDTASRAIELLRSKAVPLTWIDNV